MRTIILHVTEEDVPYLPVLKPLLVGRAQVSVTSEVPTTVTEILMSATKRGATAVVSTSAKLLALLRPWIDKPSISNYAGSLLIHKGVEFLFIDPLDLLLKVPYQKFVTKRFLDKIVAPQEWMQLPEFKWEQFNPTKVEEYYEFFSVCTLIAVDIETPIGDDQRRIACSGYCGVQFTGTSIIVRTVVVPTDSEYNLVFVRLLNGLEVPKVLQNGKYDIAYFLRFGCPLWGYLLDTINLFHSWYSELPKDLGFISAFMLREYEFHKNDGKSGGLLEYYEYNAKDVYTTVFTALAILQEFPEYALKNYLLEFPVVFPCILAEHTGLKYDAEATPRLKKQVEEQIASNLARLQILLGAPGFNPNSPKQVANLFAVLGSKDITSTDKKNQDKVSHRHPLNAFLIKSIADHREMVKLNGSYFKDGVEWKGRVFYALNPHGTDTGRLASRESQFWCGLQIQNIKRDDEDGVSAKEMFITDSGFYFGECDFSQNEARGTAYLSGDTGLIAAVDDPTRDFHGTNASKFFGLPYEDIVRSTPVIDEAGNILEWVHKTINKAIRDLAKRTNHGSNYNMGPQVMLETMGIAKVLTAKKLLGLPSGWSLIRVTTHLLDVFAKTYHILKGPWYDKVTSDVNGTGFLVGPTDWTRRCFGSPSTNKRHLNSYVAHPPQSLGAMVLNLAFRRVFNEVWLPNPTDFKLHAQIHDSILFSYRIGREDLAWKVAECMRIPVMVKDTFGVERELIVPTDLKGGSRKWTELKPLKRSTHIAGDSATQQKNQLTSLV